MPVLDAKALIDNRVEAIRAYHEQYNIERAQLDVSGGVDSAVMLGLLAKAVGPKNITAVYSSIHSSKKSEILAQEVALKFDVRLVQLEIGALFSELQAYIAVQLGNAGYDLNEISKRSRKDPTIDGGFRSCIRAPIGRFLNRVTGGGIRHGTGNECEDRWLRFYQKGGDGEVDTNPIAMLSKGEVYQLGWALKVPQEILMAVPTPDLWGAGAAHTDEEELSRLSGVEWTYSRVGRRSGEYIQVGTIERMSRFLDYYALHLQRGFIERYGAPHGFAENLDALTSIEMSMATQFGLTKKHLQSALKWERITRHKENPNCPSLGKRHYLVEEGILTDELPEFPA